MPILFIGGATEGLCAAAKACGLRAAHADTFIEAILLSGEGSSFSLIVAAAGGEEEMGQLERAVRALRSVSGRTKMLLLCEPAWEPTCRRAKDWGADDYLILPVTLADVAAQAEDPEMGSGSIVYSPRSIGGDPPHAETMEASALLDEMRADSGPRDLGKEVAREQAVVRPARPTAVGNGSQPQAGIGGNAPGGGVVPVRLSLLSLPLMVQTAMADALLQGRADLRARGLATLQGYLPWPGKLTFVPLSGRSASKDALEHTEDGGAEALAAAVEHDGTTFGTLTFEPPLPEWSGGVASQLAQAAAWLAGWMALARRQDQLRTMAITDELSGAYNRRYFQKFVRGLLEKARGERFRVSLLLFDIDNFKQYNDQFGHAAGDSIIRQLIALLRRCTRTHDLVARIGGDEFAVVFWDSEAPRQPNSEHPRDALAATQRFRKAIENHDWEGACQIRGQVSISGGIATFPWDADSLEALLKKADDALLRAKRGGKNVIILHEAGGVGAEGGTDGRAEGGQTETGSAEKIAG